VNSDLLIEALLEIDRKVLQDPRPEFQRNAKEVTSRLLSLLRYHAKIESTVDPETVVDLCYQTAQGYSDSPDLMITWLDSYIVPKQTDNNNWEEAAQCKILKAYLIAQYLIFEKRLSSLTETDFSALSPNLGCMKISQADIPASKANGQFQSETWCLATLTDALKEAVEFLAKANLFESCIEIYNTLGNIYKKEKNYKDMMWSMAECSRVCQILVEKEKGKEPRIFAKYFRVAFYGTRYEELCGKEFIYKMGPEFNLNLIQKHIQKVLQQKLPPTSLALLPNKTIDPATLDRNKVYYQIASVDPYFEPSDTSRVSLFERHFNTSTFISMQAFSEGKSSIAENLSEQKKKKTIYTSETAFPFVKNRLIVTVKREIVIEPIENAFELISERIDKIREQLEYNPPKINPLQQVLQGSVVPMVNEGPLKICETFLSAEARLTQNKDLVNKLSWAMTMFVDFCGYATKLNDGIIEDKHVNFQKMIVKYLDELRTKVEPYLNPGHKLKTVFTAEDIEAKNWRTHKLCP